MSVGWLPRKWRSSSLPGKCDYRPEVQAADERSVGLWATISRVAFSHSGLVRLRFQRSAYSLVKTFTQ